MIDYNTKAGRRNNINITYTMKLYFLFLKTKSLNFHFQIKLFNCFLTMLCSASIITKKEEELQCSTSLIKYTTGIAKLEANSNKLVLTEFFLL